MLGPSGTGKSVFLKHLVGLLKPDRGSIFIDGKDLPTLSERELYEVRRKFGVLFQDGALFGSLIRILRLRGGSHRPRGTRMPVPLGPGDVAPGSQLEPGQ